MLGAERPYQISKGSLPAHLKGARGLAPDVGPGRLGTDWLLVDLGLRGADGSDGWIRWMDNDGHGGRPCIPHLRGLASLWTVVEEALRKSEMQCIHFQV